MKVHYEIIYFGELNEVFGERVRCGCQAFGEDRTTDVSDVTCKNCLRLVENDLMKAKLKAYPNMIHNKKTGTTYKIRERKNEEAD